MVDAKYRASDIPNSDSKLCSKRLTPGLMTGSE